MNLIKKFRDLLLGSSDGEIKDRDGIYFYIKCSQCGAPVRVRADKRHDLMRDYNTGNLIWNKEIMDGACFQLNHRRRIYHVGRVRRADHPPKPCRDRNITLTPRASPPALRSSAGPAASAV